MNDLPSYSDYKKSGVEWLGKIPSHWLLIKNKFILNFSKGLTITKENLIDEGIPCVNYGEVHSKFGFEVDPNKHSLKCVPEIYLNDFPNALLKKGDFIFADTSEDIKGSGNFTYLNSELPTFAGYHTIIAKINNINYPRYLAYVFDCDSYRNQIRAQVKGIKVFSITQFMLKNSIVWLPPLEEQKAITRYLDKKLAQIDTLITKQQALLEKLAEQRIALISNAVTKGLNPDVEMKESGVEWLGKIPKHWEVKQLKFVTTCNDETLNEATEPDKEILYIDISNVSLIEGIKYKESMTFENSPSRARRIVKDGDVIISTVRTYLKAITQIKDAEDNLVVSTGFAVLRSKPEITPDFLNYWIQSSGFISSIVSNSVGVSYPAITATDLIKLPIVVFSKTEQKHISAYLDIMLKKNHDMQSLHINCITKLKEYRSTLITQAVTGKIDVRNLAN